MDEVVSALIDLALVEDVGLGDVTSEYFVPADRMARAMVLGKTDGILAGTEIAKEVFQRVDEETGVNILLDDGSHIAPGAIVMEVRGAARSLLTAERTALNFLQRLSGVATKTAEFVEAVRGTGAVILDTRKTTPGWRFLQKAAVVSGGGQNHRMGLYDRAMVKDNHLVAEGGLEALQAGIKELKEENPGVQVELEVDRLEQMEAFLTLEGVDYILLDNMDNETLAKAVAMRSENGPLLEASGGGKLETVRGVAETGVAETGGGGDGVGRERGRRRRRRRWRRRWRQ